MNPTADSVGAWLRRIEQGHPSGGIVLGLERVCEVGDRMAILRPAVPVITVAGTNGKGTTVGLLEAVLNAAGYRVGAYTSPHLHRFQERIRIGGAEVDDTALVTAFDRVEQARGETPLTYFEFTTLAAMDVFSRSGCDVWVLEVGLGGRLDAVNAVDPDVAVVTRVALDHTEFLGADLAAVAREKAGIFRRCRPAVVGQADPPEALLEAAGARGADLRRAGVDFQADCFADHSADYGAGSGGAEWGWRGRHWNLQGLPRPESAGDGWIANAATVLAVLEAIRDRLPVPEAALRAGLATPPPPGRWQRFVRGGLEWVLDVAHNADAATELVRWLDQRPPAGRRHAVFAVAARKDVDAILTAVAGSVAEWYLPEVDAPAMAPPAELAARIEARGERVAATGGVDEVMTVLEHQAGPGDQVVVLGSFFTVAAVQTVLDGGA